MKVLIVICVAVLLLQLAAVGVNLSSDERERPSEDEIESGAFSPGATVEAFEKLLDPFRQRLGLSPWDEDEKTFPAGADEAVQFSVQFSVPFSEGSEDQRVAKFELTAGTGVLIGYGCDREGARCPQVVCLCPADQPVVREDFQACGDALRLANGRCPADGDRGELVVYGKTGELRFAGLGAGGGTVRQR